MGKDVSIYLSRSFLTCFTARRSTRLSTATLDGAHANTLSPIATACLISSTTVVVLPVPGGPWITATSPEDRAYLYMEGGRGREGVKGKTIHEDRGSKKECGSTKTAFAKFCLHGTLVKLVQYTLLISSCLFSSPPISSRLCSFSSTYSTAESCEGFNVLLKGRMRCGVTLLGACTPKSTFTIVAAWATRLDLRVVRAPRMRR